MMSVKKKVNDTVKQKPKKKTKHLTIQRPRFCPIGATPTKMLENSFIRTCIGFREKAIASKSKYILAIQTCRSCPVGELIVEGATPSDILPDNDSIQWMTFPEVVSIIQHISKQSNIVIDIEEDKVMSTIPNKDKKREHFMHMLKANIKEASHTLRAADKRELLLFTFEQLVAFVDGGSVGYTKQQATPAADAGQAAKAHKKKLADEFRARTKKAAEDKAKELADAAKAKEVEKPKDPDKKVDALAKVRELVKAAKVAAKAKEESKKSENQKPKAVGTSVAKIRKLALSDDTVRSIRQMHVNGAKYKVICEKHSVSSSTVGRIVRRERYGHVI